MSKRPKPPAAGGDPPVPEKMRAKYDAIVALTDAFSRERLNDEYAAAIRRLTGVLARKRPSPLVNGTPAAWAAGIVRAVGWVNFLDDKSQAPHMKMADVDKALGVSTATGSAKSKAIRDLLKMRPFDTDWTLPSRMDRNPMAWMVTVNGLIVDVRHMPREVQEEAFRKGLIPYLPAEGEGPPDDDDDDDDDEEEEVDGDGDAGQNGAGQQVADEAPPPKSAKPRSSAKTSDPAGPAAPAARPAKADLVLATGGPRLYTLEVFLISGPITERFAKKNPVIARTIQVRGDQTLADLHRAIFDAYGRWEEHMYEFQFGKGPRDLDGPRYVLSTPAGDFDDGGPPPAGRVDQTTLDSLGLEVGRAFGYWFDFGDDWWHQINVEAVDDTVPPGKYPKVIKREGKNPPQYADE